MVLFFYLYTHVFDIIGIHILFAHLGVLVYVCNFVSFTYAIVMSCWSHSGPLFFVIK